MGRRSSGTDGEAEDVRKVVEEVAELTGKFNVSDYIGFCKNWDLQGFNKRLDDVHRRFDTMVEKAIKEKEAARAKARERHTRKAKEEEEEEDAGKDLLDILLDIHEDEGAEMRLSRENIKAFILVHMHYNTLHYYIQKNKKKRINVLANEALDIYLGIVWLLVIK